ncbi:2-hydroxyacid dehydrogenase [Marinomonas dokdonensis]|uniref:2-hydroxyacid dehydrogenase n=1 Tax=Marinomonas dokdonensis TaxID=328224 RepID=UPI004055877E
MLYGIAHSSYLDMSTYVACFDQYSDEMTLVSSDQVEDPLAITFALLWFPEDDFFERYPNVRIVASIAAGVDSILACPSLHEGVMVCRNRDPQQAAIMSTFAIWNVINHQRNFAQYRHQQAQKIWQRLPMRAPEEISVGVLGLGFMGEKMAIDLHNLGFDVAGWRKSSAQISDYDIEVFSGEKQLTDFLQRTEVLICVLPLTEQTQGILSAQLFSQLKENAYLIHLGRGGHLVSQDLLVALEEGALAGASIDVFDQEPLPQDSPLWQHPKILVTPHDASDVRPQAAVMNLVQEVRRLNKGEMPNNIVAATQGY